MDELESRKILMEKLDIHLSAFTSEDFPNDDLSDEEINSLNEVELYPVIDAKIDEAQTYLVAVDLHKRFFDSPLNFISEVLRNTPMQTRYIAFDKAWEIISKLFLSILIPLFVTLTTLSFNNVELNYWGAGIVFILSILISIFFLVIAYYIEREILFQTYITRYITHFVLNYLLETRKTKV